MKTIALIFLPLLLILPHLSAQPKVITVDNRPGSEGMYSDPQAANDDDNTKDGDTILVAGSATSYGNVTSYKKLNWVGSGYFFADNDIPGLIQDTTRLNLTFGKMDPFGTSRGSTATGIDGSISVEGDIDDGFEEKIGVSIDRCRTFGNNGWDLQGKATVTRCWLGGNLTLRAVDSSVSNSIMPGLNALNAGTVTVTNCVITNLTGGTNNTSFTNTIFVDVATTNFDQDPSYTYCMDIGNPVLPDGGNNIGPFNLQQVFADPFNGDPATDAYYQLRADSEAIAKGKDGVDMGAFGGPQPYVLSGIPDRPRITGFLVPGIATGSTTLTFEVSAQAFPIPDSQ